MQRNMKEPKNMTDKYLERRVFHYWGRADKDKRYFKKCIVDFLNIPDSRSFTQFMTEAIWRLNGEGQSTKYMYFNNYTQRLYIDKYFHEWMERTIKKIHVELKLALLMPIHSQ
jgi:hypothetical protein